MASLRALDVAPAKQSGAWEFELKEMNSEPKNFGISPPSLFSALLFAHSALAHFAHFAHFAFFAFFALVGLAAFVALEHLRHLSSLHDFDISVLSDLFYVCSPQLSTLRADRADRAVLLAPPPLAARRPRPRLCCARRADEATQRVGAGTLPLRPLAVLHSLCCPSLATPVSASLALSNPEAENSCSFECLLIPPGQ